MNSIKHWKLVRVTSVPLALTFIYFVSQATFIVTRSHTQFVSWVQTPSATAALLIFIVCGFWHAQLGMEEIFVDYVSSEKAQKLCLCVSKLFFFALGLACVYAVMAIKLGTY